MAVRNWAMTCLYHHSGKCFVCFLSFWLKMGEGLLDLTRCCEVFLWNQALYSDRIRFLIPKTMCIPFKYLTFTLLTASISCKLMIFLGTWVNIFVPGSTVVIISITWNVFKAITLLVKIFSYMLDMDLRIGIWNISTTYYKCTYSNQWVSLYKLRNS